MKQCSIVMMNFPSATKKMSYSFTNECQKEFKKLSKKFRTLSKDVERFCRVTLIHEEHENFPIDNKNYTLLKRSGGVSIFKARMACASLRGNKFRVVYARHGEDIEIIFIEMYTNTTSRSKHH